MAPGAGSGPRPRGGHAARLLGAVCLLLSPAAVDARRMLVRGVTISPEEGGGAAPQPSANIVTVPLSSQSAAAGVAGAPGPQLAVTRNESALGAPVNDTALVAEAPQNASTLGAPVNGTALVVENASALGSPVNGTALVAENVSALGAPVNGTALVAENASALGAPVNGTALVTENASGVGAPVNDTALLAENSSALGAPVNGTALVAENETVQGAPANSTAASPAAVAPAAEGAAATPPPQDREMSSDGCFIRGGDLVGCAVNPACGCGWSRHCYPRPLRPGEAPLPGRLVGNGSAASAEDVGACGPSMAALSLLSVVAFFVLLLGTVSLRIWLQWKEAARDAVMAVSVPPPVQIT